MPSAVWAGRRPKGSVRMTFGITLDQWTYDIECGLPAPAQAALPYDPLVKSEVLGLVRPRRSSVPMLQRRGPSTTLRNQSGRPVEYPLQLLATETALASIQDLQQFPELSTVVNAFRGWRFYHHFRTDPHSPIRMP
jgi:predicted ATPase